jgi:hypothetical protein
MPNNALLALILLGGFWFINQFHFTRFRAQRLDGYRLLMESAAAGVFLIIGARIVTWVLRSVPAVSSFWRESVTAEPYAGTATVAFLLGFLVPFVLNRFYSSETAKRRAIDRYGNFLLRVLQDASNREAPVSITLANGKVYIGMVAYFPNLESHDIHLGIVPLLSGHRDKETLVLKIDTEYISVYRDEKYAEEDFIVVVPTTDIKMLSFFDYRTMDVFKIEAPEEFSRMIREPEKSQPAGRIPISLTPEELNLRQQEIPDEKQ